MVQKEEIEGLFDYRDGSLYWKRNDNYSESWNTRWAGKKAGSRNQGGYIVIQYKVDGKRKVSKEHQLVWLLHKGYWAKGCIDHIDRDQSNNRIENLRDVSMHVNSFNRGANRNSKSGYKGVAWHNKNKKWTSHIFISGKKYYLGSFNSPEEAHLARQNFELEVFDDVYRNVQLAS